MRLTSAVLPFTLSHLGDPNVEEMFVQLPRIQPAHRRLPRPPWLDEARRRIHANRRAELNQYVRLSIEIRIVDQRVESDSMAISPVEVVFVLVVTSGRASSPVDLSKGMIEGSEENQ